MVESFDKLNDSNWGQWKMFMKAVLVKKNVWEIVNGTETLPAGSSNAKPVRAFRRKQAEAIAEITLRVQPAQLSFIQDEDPKVVWDTLTNVHQAPEWPADSLFVADFCVWRSPTDLCKVLSAKLVVSLSNLRK
jgi:hypothetical protein